MAKKEKAAEPSEEDGEAREGLLVTVLRPSDQLGIHARSALAAPDQVGHSQGMGAIHLRVTQSSSDADQPAALAATRSNEAATAQGHRGARPRQSLGDRAGRVAGDGVHRGYGDLGHDGG